MNADLFNLPVSSFLVNSFRKRLLSFQMLYRQELYLTRREQINFTINYIDALYNFKIEKS